MVAGDDTTSMDQVQAPARASDTQVAVLGEALIDLATEAPMRFRGYPGGSPMNTAVAAARLGAHTAFVSQLSTDFFGDALLAHLHDNAVQTRWIERGPAPSTLAFVDRQAATNRYAFYVEGCADAQWDPAELPRLPDACRYVCHGSFSLLRDPAGRRILEFVAAQPSDRVIVLDPNIRPSLIPSAARYRPQFEAWLSRVHLLKLSDEDVAFIAPGEALQDVAARWFGLGVRAIVLTLGPRGAQLLRPASDPARGEGPSPSGASPAARSNAIRTLSACPVPVQVVDTIGAGDTLTAGLMCALLNEGVGTPGGLDRLSDRAWQRVIDFACAAATLNCARAGANPPTRGEVLAALGALGGSPAA